MATTTANPIPAGITIKTAPHGANLIQTSRNRGVTSALELLARSCQGKSEECKELLQSSFQPHLQQPALAPLEGESNGFVNGAIRAYNQHHHFVIRPEDVWFAILTQFSCYVNAHSEELRDLFVAHEGKKELRIDMEGSRYTVDFGWFAEEMGRLLEKNVVDRELREWIVPNFTTTTGEDTIVASVLMMSTLQKYFSYYCCISCGIPSMRLLGTEGDWENMLLRLEKLKTYGVEPTKWYGLLKPVLSMFVQTFKSPDSEEVLDFWQKIAHEYNMGSGPTYLSGWITAFCFWDADGKMLYQEKSLKENSRSKDNSFNTEIFHTIDVDKVPAGYASVPVKVDDNGYVFDATMIAGSVGLKATSSGKELENARAGLDTLQPVSGWWMYEKHG